MRSFLGALLFCFTILPPLGAGANFYTDLGVKPESTKAEIKSAWKKLVRQYHPDRFMGDPEEMKIATEKLAIINAAETILGNEVYRVYYDYLSAQGKNHQYWARILFTQNPEKLEKAYGSVEKVRGKFFAQAAPRSTPGHKPTPKPEPTPKTTPAPEAKEPPSRTEILELFKKDIFNSKKWGHLGRLFLQQNPQETSPQRQLELLDLLRLPLQETHLEVLSYIVAASVEAKDLKVLENLHELLLSKNPSLRKVSVSLLHYAIELRRSGSLFHLDSAAAESLLIAHLEDSDKIVRARSELAVKKLNIKISKNYDSLGVIAKLSHPDITIRNQSFQDLFYLKTFNESELKSLVSELLVRRQRYEALPDERLLMEMTSLIEVLESVPDLGSVEEEFKKFRNNILGKDLVLRSYALEKRIQNQSAQHRVCRKVFN